MTDRTGALGAMMDEYERAMRDLTQLVGSLGQEAFLQIRDGEGPDENSRTLQSVIKHVLQAGYAYVHYLRKALGMPFEKPDYRVETPADAVRELEAMVYRTAETFEGKWEMTFQAMAGLQFRVRWGPTYNLEQLLEHAIVHVLRHRRQLEKLLTWGSAL